MQFNEQDFAESQSEDTITLTEMGQTSMAKNRDKPDVKLKYKQERSYTKAERFACRMRIFKDADPKIFIAFIKRQDRELKGKGLWVGEHYLHLVKQQENDWATDCSARCSDYCRGGSLIDPEKLPMGLMWYAYALQNKKKRDGCVVRLEYVPSEESLKVRKICDDNLKRYDAVEKELEKDLGHVKRIQEVRDKWKKIRELRESKAKLMAQKEIKPVEEKILKPVKTYHWADDILAFATDQEESSEEIEEIKESSPLPGTKRHWDAWQEKMGEYLPVQRSESPDVERVIQVKRTGATLWGHDYQKKLLIIDPQKLQEQKDAHYERKKERRAAAAKEKRELKELTKEECVKARKQRDADRQRENRSRAKSLKTCNASTADQEM